VVKAPLTGSLIGDLLLVLGGAILTGGIKHERQHFNVTAARAQVTLNTELIELPKDLGDFVIVHELVHLLAPKVVIKLAHLSVRAHSRR
jgi:calcium/proton exchanger cax